VEHVAIPWEGKELGVTISIGAAVFRDILDEGQASKIIRTADAELYAAKCAGRNKVRIAVDGATRETLPTPGPSLTGPARRDNTSARPHGGATARR